MKVYILYRECETPADSNMHRGAELIDSRLSPDEFLTNPAWLEYGDWKYDKSFNQWFNQKYCIQEMDITE